MKVNEFLDDLESSLEGIFDKFKKKKNKKEVEPIIITTIESNSEYEKLLKKFIDDCFIARDSIPNVNKNTYNMLIDDVFYPKIKWKIDNKKHVFEVFNLRRKLNNSIVNEYTISVKGDITKSIPSKILEMVSDNLFRMEMDYVSSSKSTYLEFSPLFDSNVSNNGNDKTLSETWKKCATIINETYKNVKEFINKVPLISDKYSIKLPDWDDIESTCDPSNELLIKITTVLTSDKNEVVVCGDGAGNTMGLFKYKNVFYTLDWDHEVGEFSLNMPKNI